MKDKYESYAQNFEDILASRFFNYIGRNLGVSYLDIGCGSPLRENNTAVFCLNNGFGIAIDAFDYSKMYSELRPNDMFIQALMVTESDDDIYFFPDSVNPHLSSTEGVSGPVVESSDLEKLSFVDAFRFTKMKLGQINFLNIDVETPILNLRTYLEETDFFPDLICLEVNRIGDIFDDDVFTQVTSEIEAIDDAMLGSKYKRVYFDGLNIFLLNFEKEVNREASRIFEVPVGRFDVECFSLFEARKRLYDLQTESNNLFREYQRASKNEIALQADNEKLKLLLVEAEKKCGDIK